MPTATFNYLIELLREIRPTLDTRSGTAVRDILLAPLSDIMEQQRNDLSDFISNWSLNDVDDIPETVMDQIASFYMLTRSQGSNAQVVVRIYLSTPTDITIRESDGFSTGDGISFFPTKSIAASAAALQYDSATNYYYYDVDCEAQGVGDEFNIGEQQIINGPALENVVKFTNINPSTGGSSRETNAELLLRIQNAISHKSMETKTGATSILTDRFPEISAVYASGFGDELMERDMRALPVKLSNITGWRTGSRSSGTSFQDKTFFADISLGGAKDVFSHKVLINTGLQVKLYSVISAAKDEDSLTVTVDDTLPDAPSFQFIMFGHSYQRFHMGNRLDLWLAGIKNTGEFYIQDATHSNVISQNNNNITNSDGSPASLYFPMAISRVVALDPLTWAEIAYGELEPGSDYSVTCYDENLRGSVREDGLLSINIIDEDWTGLPLKVEYIYDSTVINAQNYIDSDDYKSPSCDALVRVMNTAHVDVAVTVPKGAWDRPLIAADNVRDFMADYFNNKTGDFEVSGDLSFWGLWNAFHARFGRNAEDMTITIELEYPAGASVQNTSSRSGPVKIAVPNNFIYSARAVTVS